MMTACPAEKCSAPRCGISVLQMFYRISRTLLMGLHCDVFLLFVFCQRAIMPSASTADRQPKGLRDILKAWQQTHKKGVRLAGCKWKTSKSRRLQLSWITLQSDMLVFIDGRELLCAFNGGRGGLQVSLYSISNTSSSEQECRNANHTISFMKYTLFN